MFQFPPFASRTIKAGMPALQAGGLSHSEIPGSKDMCSYPGLIAACRVLHRLREPRHPPCALSFLIYAFRRTITCMERLRRILSAVLLYDLSRM